MQSNLPNNFSNQLSVRARLVDALVNIRPMFKSSRLALTWGPVTRKLLLRTALLYGAIYLLAMLISVYPASEQYSALSAGLLFPGAGFLFWANPFGSAYLWFIGMFIGALGLFAVAMVLWFATGNIIAPVLIWFGSAVVAAIFGGVEFGGAGFGVAMFGSDTAIDPLAWPVALQFIQVLAPLSVLLAFVAKAERSEKLAAQYRRFCERTPLVSVDSIDQLVSADSLNYRDSKESFDSMQPADLNEPDSSIQHDHSVESRNSSGPIPDPSSEQGASTGSIATAAEMSLSDLQMMRALLDRSLQPVESFEGFDKLDQFQTAALRYQINFVSYALSVCSQVHLPAARSYMHEAQLKLALKLLDPRVWGYWKLENLWGNFSTSADPIPRDNIMLSGFLSAQFGLARRQVAMNEFDGDQGLIFRTRKGQEFRYSLAEVCDILKRQYQAAPYGLLACEPNWVFPLCNSITAVGMRSLDVQHGTCQWDEISDRFRQSLQDEFISANGLLVPFRSSRTGIAAPMIGGGAMQSFPCLFLNSLLPDVAARQWQLTRENLQQANGKRALWPVDIGNYRINRAASYSACAATAVEMGDMETALRMLDYLDDDHPLTVESGVAHRSGVSLWAHALEFMARAGDVNALRSAVNSSATDGPVILDVCYPEVLLASAHSQGGCLQAVLYPADKPTQTTLHIGELLPNRRYQVGGDRSFEVSADPQGNVCLNLFVAARTELSLSPLN